jgi:3-deoxy-manno-octulosonate cytidylyltransferase (CMP-KDO synthetase)
VSVVVIIPARYASTRLPGKALADIAGKPMIAHVLRRAQAARGVDRVLVATDDERVASVVEAEGGEAVMTRPEHRSGTDRIAEVADGLACDVVVNVQGDLPLLDPGYVEAAVDALRSGSRGRGAGQPVMSTLATPILPGEIDRPQVVKVVCDRFGDALYFSRRAIPWHEGDRANGAAIGTAIPLRHIGLYAFRRAFLLDLARLEPTPLERSERLEQLRVLEHGFRIRVAAVDAAESMIEVDTPEDLERAREVLTSRREGDGTGRKAMRVRHG